MGIQREIARAGKKAIGREGCRDGPKCRSEDEGEKRGTGPRGGRATDENGPNDCTSKKGCDVEKALWRS